MKYKSRRIIDKKPIWVIVDENEKIINKSPSKEELKCVDIPLSKKKLYNNRKYLIGRLWHFYNKNKKIPMCADFTNNPEYPSQATYWRIFGSWNNALKEAGLWEKRYNPTHTCDRCRKSFGKLEFLDHPRKEYDEKRKWTGNWDCPTCYRRYDPNSIDNIRKEMTDIRLGVGQDSETAKGEEDVNIVCEVFEYVNLNKKCNSYNTPIDCLDEKIGLLYQVQGRRYNPDRGDWPFNGFEREWYKEYESMICLCRNSDGSIIEEIYIFPSWIIIGKMGVDIYKSPMNTAGTSPIIPWYEEYRIKGKKREDILKKANDILKRKLEKRKEV